MLLLWEYSITATGKKTNTKPYSLIAHSLFNASINGLIHWESYQHKAPPLIAHLLCNESISGLIHRGSYQSLFSSTTTREPHFQYVSLGEGDISHPNYNNMGNLKSSKLIAAEGLGDDQMGTLLSGYMVTVHDASTVLYLSKWAKLTFYGKKRSTPWSNIREYESESYVYYFDCIDDITDANMSNTCIFILNVRFYCVCINDISVKLLE